MLTDGSLMSSTLREWRFVLVALARAASTASPTCASNFVAASFEKHATRLCSPAAAEPFSAAPRLVTYCSSNASPITLTECTLRSSKLVVSFQFVVSTQSSRMPVRTTTVEPPAACSKSQCRSCSCRYFPSPADCSTCCARASPSAYGTSSGCDGCSIRGGRTLPSLALCVDASPSPPRCCTAPAARPANCSTPAVGNIAAPTSPLPMPMPKPRKPSERAPFTGSLTRPIAPLNTPIPKPAAPWTSILPPVL
mmetsp:Transcript_19002/g.31823  ORF Transcript_19002/g.31823 Transcript_19002/m.31823 type:complete len:252 (+) Transcript_19002:716-1471(+)